jgi:hypothetical protein
MLGDFCAPPAPHFGRSVFYAVYLGPLFVDHLDARAVLLLALRNPDHDYSIRER